MAIDLATEQRKIIRAAIGATLFCIVGLLAAYIALPRWFDFPVELEERLAFAIRADIFVLLWVVVGVRMVSRGRFYSPADIGGSAAGPPSPSIAERWPRNLGLAPK